MKKFQFKAFDPITLEIIPIESSVGHDIVIELQKGLNNIINDITVSPIALIPDDLSVRWGIIEKIDGKDTLTHYISIKPNINNHSEGNI